MEQSQKTKKHDFVEIKYTGYANNEIFDSNILEDLKKLDSKATEVQKTIIVIGEGMVAQGLDKALEDKDYNRNYEIELTPKESFGERNKNLVRIIPLKAFTEQKLSPKPGMAFVLDNSLVKILAVSGARVTVDFNNPLAGKNIKYKFEIIKKVEDEKEKIETLFKMVFHIIPEYEIKEKTVVVEGPKDFEMFVNSHKEKFKELLGKELEFQEISRTEVLDDAQDVRI